MELARPAIAKRVKRIAERATDLITAALTIITTNNAESHAQVAPALRAALQRIATMDPLEQRSALITFCDENPLLHTEAKRLVEAEEQKQKEEKKIKAASKEVNIVKEKTKTKDKKTHNNAKPAKTKPAKTAPSRVPDRAQVPDDQGPHANTSPAGRAHPRSALARAKPKPKPMLTPRDPEDTTPALMPPGPYNGTMQAT